MIYLPGTNRIFTSIIKKLWNFFYFGKNAVISPSCDIKRRAAPHISIGDDVILAKDVWLNIPKGATSFKDQPIITIGNSTTIGRRSTISGINKICIGEKVLFAPNVFITDHFHEYKDTNLPIFDQGITQGGIIIVEKGCWLGHNCAIITHRGQEVRIGENTVIGANAVVSKSCPKNSTLIGIPARNVGPMIRRCVMQTNFSESHIESYK